jgi:hypothetical protein
MPPNYENIHFRGISQRGPLIAGGSTRKYNVHALENRVLASTTDMPVRYEYSGRSYKGAKIGEISQKVGLRKIYIVEIRSSILGDIFSPRNEANITIVHPLNVVPSILSSW